MHLQTVKFISSKIRECTNLRYIILFKKCSWLYEDLLQRLHMVPGPLPPAWRDIWKEGGKDKKTGKLQILAFFAEPYELYYSIIYFVQLTWVCCYGQCSDPCDWKTEKRLLRLRDREIETKLEIEKECTCCSSSRRGQCLSG